MKIAINFTEQQLLRFSEEIHEVLCRKCLCIVRFLDLVELFYKIWHERLIHKLFEFSPIQSNWFTAFCPILLPYTNWSQSFYKMYHSKSPTRSSSLADTIKHKHILLESVDYKIFSLCRRHGNFGKFQMNKYHICLLTSTKSSTRWINRKWT